MNRIKKGEIYRWSYSKNWLDNCSNYNAKTLYFCCSRIGIVKESIDESILLIDTYWPDSYMNRSFTIDEVKERLDIGYKGNMNYLEKAKISAREKWFYKVSNKG